MNVSYVYNMFIAGGVRHGWFIASVMGQEDLSVDLRVLEGPHHRAVERGGRGGGGWCYKLPSKKCFQRDET